MKRRRSAECLRKEGNFLPKLNVPPFFYFWFRATKTLEPATIPWCHTKASYSPPQDSPLPRYQKRKRK